MSQPIQVMSKIRMISDASSTWNVSSPYPAPNTHPAIGGITAGRHDGRIPGLVHQVSHTCQQRIERCAGQAIQLDEGGTLEPDAVAHKRSGQPGTISSTGTEPSRLPTRADSCTARRRSSNPGSE